MRETLYSIGSCPLCWEGDIIIVKDTRRGVYVLICDECDLVWKNPRDALDYNLSLNYDCEPEHLNWTVTEEELDESGWRQHVIRLLQ
jgi:hypothetical protein